MAYALAQEVDQDQALIEAVQAGDGEGLADLIVRNERWVRGVVYSVLADANLLGSAGEATGKFVETDRIFQPDPSRHAHSQEKWTQFRRMRRALQD